MNTGNCKRPGWFRCASFGDVHLGNPNTPTIDIIRGLDRMINEDFIKQLDMLIIEGDLFDRLLQSDDDNLYRIHAWATRLMVLCGKHNTMLVVLKGTPSHDWSQNQYFVEQQVNAGIDVELIYAKNLSIEYIERFGSYFLFVPDRCLPHTDDIYREVKVLLKNNNIEQVDFAVMHGAFRYQLPEIVEEPTHNEQNYLDIVKYFIFIGHVHQMSQYERILAAGSFDRYCHGDESPKGIYDVSVKEDGTHRITFIVNEKAKKYITIDCRGLGVQEVNDLIAKRLVGLPKGSSIRIHCYKHDPIVTYADTAKGEHRDYEWVPPKIEELDKKKKESVVDVLAKFDMSSYVPIMADNLLELLKPELTKHAKDEVSVLRCLKHAETILEV